jgi:CubicO group peptidase (beta-lactamase class C family)
MVDAEKTGFSTERLARIRPALEKHVGDDKLAGVVTMLMRRDELMHTECLGVMDRAARRPMQPDSIFRLYSMTKPITCVGFMRLYEQGHFQLTDPVSKFIPAFADMQVWSDGGAVDLETAVTIEHLLTHTSGLTYHFWEYGPVEQRYRKAGVSSTQPLAEFVVDLTRLPLAFQPGSRYRYGFSHDVVAHLIEIMADQPFDEYLHAEIFQPLGMVDSGFYVPVDKHERFTGMYGTEELFISDMTGTRWKDGAEKSALIAGPTDSLESAHHNTLRGGHGLVSTGPDYLRFCRMMLNGGVLDGERILGRKTVEMMTTNHLPVALLPVEEGGLYRPGFGYGLGFGSLMDPSRTGTIGSVGEFAWTGAATTSFWIDPVEELIGIQLSQFQPMAYHLVAEDFRVAAYQALVD